MAELTLLHGEKVLVDAGDLPALQMFRWYLGSNGYVYAQMKTGRPVAMHAYLMNTPKGYHTDHINGNRLDNRRANLRVCTPQENLANRPSIAGERNPFFGRTHSEEVKRRVSLKFGKPVLQLTKDGQVVGSFPSILAAKRATGISDGNISSVCRGKRKTAGGYTWKYKADQ